MNDASLLHKTSDRAHFGPPCLSGFFLALIRARPARNVSAQDSAVKDRDVRKPGTGRDGRPLTAYSPLFGCAFGRAGVLESAESFACFSDNGGCNFIPDSWESTTGDLLGPEQPLLPPAKGGVTTGNSP